MHGPFHNMLIKLKMWITCHIWHFSSMWLEHSHHVSPSVVMHTDSHWSTYLLVRMLFLNDLIHVFKWSMKSSSTSYQEVETNLLASKTCYSKMLNNEWAIIEQQWMGDNRCKICKASMDILCQNGPYTLMKQLLFCILTSRVIIKGWRLITPYIHH